MAGPFYYAVGPYTTRREGGITFTVPPTGATGIDLRSIPGHADLTYGLFWSSQPFGKDYRTFGRGDLRDITEWDRGVFASMFGLRTVAGDSLADALWALLMLDGDPTGEDRCPPLMPGHRRNLDLVLADHGVVRTRQFEPGLAEAPVVREVLRRQYRKHRTAARDGKLKDEVHHLRVLDAWCEKYGLNEDYFRPADLPFEARVPHETPLTETFTKSNGPLGGDNTWVDFHGTSVYTVDTNEAVKGSAFGASRLDTALSSDDHYAEAVVTNTSVSVRTVGVIGRQTGDSTVTYYLAAVDTGNNGETWRWIAGSGPTQVGSQTFAAWSNGDVIRLECDGTTITRLRNGSIQVAQSDPSGITGELYTGIGSVHSTSGGALDDFEANDLVAGGTDALLADDIASSTSVGSPAIGQAHALAASDVASASSVTTPAIGQVHALSASDISASPSVGAPALAEGNHALSANDVASASLVGSPAIGQVHALSAADIASATSVSAPTLTEGQHVLLADDIAAAPTVGAPALGQVHALLAGDIVVTTSVGAPALGEPGATTAPGLEYTLARGPMHYTVEREPAHYTVPARRLHYTG